MKKKTLNITLLTVLLTLLFNVTIVQATSDSIMVSDDFSFTTSDITIDSTGHGWADKWMYKDEIGGVMANEGYIYRSASGGRIIVRTPLTSLSLNDETFYTSYLVRRTASGVFKILGARNSSGDARWSIEINANGNVGLGVAASSRIYSETPLVDADKTYFMVTRYEYAGSIGGQKKGHMKTILFDADETIPTNEADVVWDMDTISGNTGVSIVRFDFHFEKPGIIVDKFKLGNSWKSVTDGISASDYEFVLPAPAAPDAIYPVATSETALDLSWSVNSFEAVNYGILLDGVEIAKVTDGNAYEIMGLTVNQDYSIGVYAYKGDVNSDTTELLYTHDFVDTDIDIASTTTAPTVDGIVDIVWENAVKHQIKSFDESVEAAPESVEDFTATWSAMWDNYNLYFLIEVSDDMIKFFPKDGSSIGHYDGFDFAFSKGAPADITAQTICRLYLQDNTADTTFETTGTEVQNAVKSFIMSDKGFNMEFSIAWTDIDADIDPFNKVGYGMGLDLRYNDRDNGDKRDGQYCWQDKLLPEWGWLSGIAQGTVTLADKVSAISEKVAPSFKVAMNNDATVLRVFNYQGAATIYDITGKQVLKVKDATLPINVSMMNNGIYIIKTEVGAIKFVK